jgi:hypothetical protein
MIARTKPTYEPRRRRSPSGAEGGLRAAFQNFTTAVLGQATCVHCGRWPHEHDARHAADPARRSRCRP